MSFLAKGLIGLAAIAFAFAVVAAITPRTIMGIPAEGFSRACSNLALLGLAVAYVFRAKEK